MATVAALWVPVTAIAAATGGTAMPDKPAVDRIDCVPTAISPCPPSGSIVQGGRLVLGGSDLAETKSLVFLGHRGARDDVRVRPASASTSRLEAPVPARARSGRLLLITKQGIRMTTKTIVRVARPAPIDAAPGDAFFFDGARRPSVTFTVERPRSVTIELIRENDSEVVEKWDVAATPDAPGRVEWSGRGAAGAAPSGRYRFRIGGEVSGAAATEGSEPFSFYDHLFPIRGKHDLGQTETNNFGGGRGHKGQDMFARCGTRVAAARGGRVEFAGYHSAAGNYVVIDGEATGVDHVYMHMLQAPLVKTGQEVTTGQALGQVGQTGRASGCHLHFEAWSAPGWYKGGAAFDPLPQLKVWDTYS